MPPGRQRIAAFERVDVVLGVYLIIIVVCLLVRQRAKIVDKSIRATNVGSRLFGSIGAADIPAASVWFLGYSSGQLGAEIMAVCPCEAWFFPPSSNSHDAPKLVPIRIAFCICLVISAAFLFVIAGPESFSSFENATRSERLRRQPKSWTVVASVFLTLLDCACVLIPLNDGSTGKRTQGKKRRIVDWMASPGKARWIDKTMLGVLIFALLLVYTVFFYRKVGRYPNGPLPLPFVGNLHQIRPHNLHKKLHTLGKEYGHCFTLFLPHPVVVFTDYSHIKAALVDHGEHFIARSQRPPETLLQKDPQTGVISSDGEVHRSIAELKKTVHGMAIDPTSSIELCVANVINETLFGYHFAHGDSMVFDEFVKLIHQHIVMIRTNIFTPLIAGWPWLMNIPITRRLGHDVIVNNSRKYIDIIESEVNKAADTFDPDAAPSNFVHAYMAEMETNSALDMKNLYAIAGDFWLAGMETTSTTLRTALVLLMAFPDVQDRMRSELLGVVGSDRIVSMADKSSLPYFMAVIAEMQRWMNMIPFLFSHKCTRDSVICGKTIPAGTITMPQIYSVLVDDPVFENPEEFRPERFLLDDGKTSNKAALERMIAFGMGKRQCAGEGLARMEIFLVLASLIQAYRFVPESREAASEILDNRIYGAAITPLPYQCRLEPVS